MAPSYLSSILVKMAEQEYPLSAAMLAAASPQDQKQMLGDNLYLRIQRMYPHIAGKITGMLLGLETAELLELLADGSSLRSKVEEAVAVLRLNARRNAGMKRNIGC